VGLLGALDEGADMYCHINLVVDHVTLTDTLPMVRLS
jgi:hypothetical protein